MESFYLKNHLAIDDKQAILLSQFLGPYVNQELCLVLDKKIGRCANKMDCSQLLSTFNAFSANEHSRQKLFEFLGHKIKGRVYEMSLEELVGMCTILMPFAGPLFE